MIRLWPLSLVYAPPLRLLRKLSVVLSSVLLLIQCGPKTEQPSFGTINFIIGSAEIFTKDKSRWQPAELLGIVSAGDSLRTQAESRIEIKHHNGNMVTVGEKTTIAVGDTVDGASKKRSFIIMDVCGTVLAQMEKLAATKETFEVRTPTAIAAVRGTYFSVYFDPELQSTDVNVLEGTVMVSDLHRTAGEVINAGFFTVVLLHAVPVRPAPLNYGQFKKIERFMNPRHVDHYYKKYNIIKMEEPLGSFFKGTAIKDKHGEVKEQGKKVFKAAGEKKGEKPAGQ